MDTTTPTPSNKSRKMPGKKTMLIVLALVLAAGATGAYLYRNRPEAKKADTNQQAGDGDKQGVTEVEPLEQIDPKDLAARYAYSQGRLDNLDKLSDSEKITLYTSLAYDGAALDKKEARDYAKTALELVPEASKDDEATKAIREVLTEVAAGKYSTAKAIVMSALED